jgi:hypothetical protein
MSSIISNIFSSAVVVVQILSWETQFVVVSPVLAVIRFAIAHPLCSLFGILFLLFAFLHEVVRHRSRLSRTWFSLRAAVQLQHKLLIMALFFLVLLELLPRKTLRSSVNLRTLLESLFTLSSLALLAYCLSPAPRALLNRLPTWVRLYRRWAHGERLRDVYEALDHLEHLDAEEFDLTDPSNAEFGNEAPTMPIVGGNGEPQNVFDRPLAPLHLRKTRLMIFLAKSAKGQFGLLKPTTENRLVMQKFMRDLLVLKGVRPSTISSFICGALPLAFIPSQDELRYMRQMCGMDQSSRISEMQLLQSRMFGDEQ